MRSTALRLLPRQQPVTSSSIVFSLRSMSTSGTSAAEASSSRPRTPTRIPGPIETSIQSKLIEIFQPVLIRVTNDSSKHAKHKAMRDIGGGSGETHFAVHMVSPAFSGKTPIARHRLVNALLKDEFDNMGLHALSLRLKSPEEWQKEGGGEVQA